MGRRAKTSGWLLLSLLRVRVQEGKRGRAFTIVSQSAGLPPTDCGAWPCCAEPALEDEMMKTPISAAEHLTLLRVNESTADRVEVNVSEDSVSGWD